MLRIKRFLTGHSRFDLRNSRYCGRRAAAMTWKLAGLVLITIGAIACGCKKKPPVPEPSSTPAYQTIARAHWLGKNQIAEDTNAISLMGVWHLPESARLESQTLGKLSLLPW